MPSRYRSLFSYYGGKSKIAHHYPPPRYDVIIEPFAGGAAYSLLYADRNVILNEANPRTAAIWHYFLTTPLEDILAAIPPSVAPGKRVSDIVDTTTAHPGLVALLRAEANHGTAGCRGTHDVVTPVGARCWPRLRERLAYWWPKTRHWLLLQGDYTALENIRATWFIDPPYSPTPDRSDRYEFSDLDYDDLAVWCRSRLGQVIVCENEGARRLPFRPLVRALGMGNRRRAVEAIWTQDDESVSYSGRDASESLDT